ncbi:hypothetical protein [Paenibacillus xylaniclasticus]|uniref:hypothetical protein n=1 Tax=Paenibacillus xylaniclasticus TaxID=588083 RepID=UPI000FD8FE5F|nr:MULTISPECIES: hypothetical protein [Paenibacillus]GFN32449.1 hypothetical protein PCURB6_27090 [Paenibacillus curdlanolyticus]
MGCDIHLFIEYRGKDSEYWWNFGGKFNLSRDYYMFARLAGVRAYGEEIKPIADRRGLPQNIGWKTKDENRYFIINDDEERDDSRQVKRTDAERWVRDGLSQYEEEHWVTDPDWHSHSWLTSNEFEKCVNSFDDVNAEYKAILASLRCFEQEGYETRVVFWFDN